MAISGRLGLDSYSYHLAFGRHPDFAPSHPIDLHEFIMRVSRLGLSGFEIDPLHLGSDDEEHLASIRALAKHHHLWIEYGMGGVDPGQAASALGIARSLGCQVLRTFINADRYSKSVSLSVQLQHAVASLRLIAPLAERHRIRYAIENHGDVTSRELVEVIRQVGSPWVGACLDIGNSMLVFEDPVEAAINLAPYTMNVHFKDYAVRMENYGMRVTGAALGQGVIDIRRILAILEQHAPEAKLNIEIPFERMDDEAAALAREDDGISESVRYARQELRIA